MNKNYEYYSKDLITRIGYIWFSSFREFVKNPHSILRCYFGFVFNCICSILHLRIKNPPVAPIIFFSISQNNDRALFPVCNKLKENTFCMWKAYDDLPLTIINFYSLITIIKFHKCYLNLDADDRKLVRNYIGEFIRINGYYIYFKRFLERNKKNIKLVVMANDHHTPNRALIEVCKFLSIRTLYMQHAAVADNFPPLMFDYSFLDGLDSYEFYERIGINNGKIFLSGSPRFDYLPMLNNVRNCIGIAINILDDIEKIYELCSFLSKKQSNRLILRPHPAMNIKEFPCKKFLQLGIEISCAATESSFSFISRIFLLISNQSSIHLDAAMMGVPSVLYNMSSNKYEYEYSFYKKGLVPICDKKEKILEFINDTPAVNFKIVQDYNAAILSNCKNNVSSIIAGFINVILDDEDENLYIKKYFDVKNGIYVLK